MDAPRDRIIDYRYIKAINGVGIDAEYAFIQLCSNFAAYDWTQAAADTLAKSHRGFHVGSMIIAVDRELCRMGTFFGGNIKLLAGDDPNKICAERVALRKVREAGFPEVVGVAVYGPYQPDSHTGMPSDTLRPCGLCRAEFAAAPEMSLSIEIVRYGAGEKMEHFTLEELLRKYGVPFPIA